MALSGVNQSHGHPVWVEIPSRPANIGAVPKLFAASPTDNTGNLSALPVENQLNQGGDYVLNIINMMVLNIRVDF